MVRMGLDRLFAFVSHCHVALDKTGLHVEQALHLNDVARAAATLRMPRLSRALDPALSDFTRDNAIWLYIYHRDSSDRNRQLVGLVGARVERLAPGEFADALTGRFNRLYGKPGEPALHDTAPPPIFDEISGRVAYVDDLFILPEFRGGKGANLRALLLLLFAYARVEWNFDWLYGFVPRDHAARDYLATYCFASTYPTPLVWNAAVDDKSGDDIFGCSSREDFNYLTELIARRPDLLTSGSTA